MYAARLSKTTKDMTRFTRLIGALMCTLLIIPTTFAQQAWQPVNVRLATRWTKDVSPDNALKEYPRPQLVRKEWTNLNGLWHYAVTDTSVQILPAHADGEILVPYPLESALSGVQKMLKPNQYLWYKKTVSMPVQPGKRTILHFGAVDNEATIFVNGKNVGSHKGGYTAFSFDITKALHNGENEIAVKVYDPTDQGVYPHGKQVSDPANIYYTPSSGIWQTVWLEQVPDIYISALTLTPDVDDKSLQVKVEAPKGYTVKLTGMDNGKPVAEAKGSSGNNITLPVYDPKLWSPSHPFLYDLKVHLLKGNKVIDEVTSYFGMRKVSVGKDNKGFYRIFLNNQYVYNLGTLDQGFWPDGLYTAPTDEALKFDIEAIKAMGFNTIRKHIKVEPARWYYHADKIGMLVWQDFVNPNQSLPEGAKPAFEQQLNETIDQLYNHPSITTWVLFNERWGQYDQKRLTEYVKKKDPTRLLNAHSGELLWVNEQLRAPADNPWVGSDIADVHAYPDPMNAPPKEGRVQILGEFGGIGVFIPDHQWLSNKSWGYVQVTPAQLQGKYTIMNQHLQLLERDGLAGSIYTQPYDVEGEENGLMTYDREVIKIPVDSLRKIHSALVPSGSNMPTINIANADLTDPGARYAQLLQRYIDGERDRSFLRKLSMMAAQVGDKNGKQRIGADYVANIKGPLTEDNIQEIAEFTSSTKDAGFKLMNDYAQQFKASMGERPYTVKMMNLIYIGEMKDLLENTSTPDWPIIERRVKPYGAPGEEILLRAKTVHYFNAQDWDNYSTVAKEYLDKYGSNLPDNERKMFDDALSNGKASAK
jgi:hypothetical protein